MPKITLAKYIKRLLLCLAILVVHYLVVFVPISELFLLYIIFSSQNGLKILRLGGVMAAGADKPLLRLYKTYY